MVRQETVGNECNPTELAYLFDQEQRVAIVLIRAKDRLPICAPIVHVIIGALNKLKLTSWHGGFPLIGWLFDDAVRLAIREWAARISLDREASGPFPDC